VFFNVAFGALTAVLSRQAGLQQHLRWQVVQQTETTFDFERD